ncbi:hypothetical protein WAI453_007106 [Rhynchosporium graminicola]
MKISFFVLSVLVHLGAAATPRVLTRGVVTQHPCLREDRLRCPADPGTTHHRCLSPFRDGGDPICLRSCSGAGEDLCPKVCQNRVQRQKEGWCIFNTLYTDSSSSRGT